MVNQLIIKGEALYKKIEGLTEVKVDYINWLTFYIDEFNGEKWMKEYPHAEYHGGGAPQLRLLEWFPWENKWLEDGVTYLREGKGLHDFRNLLLVMKENGITKEEAYSLFEEIRKKMVDEKKGKEEDLILEVLDIISGYCASHLKVW